MVKFCKRCNTEKPVSEFGKNASRADGLASYCRDCYGEVRREFRAKQKENKQKDEDVLKEIRSLLQAMKEDIERMVANNAETLKRREINSLKGD